MTTSVVGLAILVEGGLLLLALALGRLLDVPLLERLRPDGRGLVLGVAATLPLLLVLWWTLHTPVPPVRRLVRLVEERLGPLFAQCTGAELLLIALLAGLAEEALFRGVLQGALERVVPVPAAVLGAGVLFGLAHLVTPTYGLLAGLIGAYLGLLLVWSGSLVAPTVAHALYDYVALILLVRRRREAAPLPADADAG